MTWIFPLLSFVSFSKVRLPNNSTLSHTFSAEDHLQAVIDFVKQTISPNFELMTTFPRKVYGPADFSKSLKELRKLSFFLLFFFFFS